MESPLMDTHSKCQEPSPTHYVNNTYAYLNMWCLKKLRTINSPLDNVW